MPLTLWRPGLRDPPLWPGLLGPARSFEPPGGVSLTRLLGWFVPNSGPMPLRERTYPRLGIRLGIVEPCLPSPAKAPPSGPGWVHEFKHDGIRILARRDGAGVRLFTSAGDDFSSRFPFIAMAVSKLPVRSCLIDGEAIVCDENGVAVFELIRGHDAGERAVLSAFDLLELDGKDLRRKPIEKRKELLAELFSTSVSGRTARSYSVRLASSVVRALCRNGLARFIVVVSHRFGSKSKIQTRRR